MHPLQPTLLLLLTTLLPSITTALTLTPSLSLIQPHLLPPIRPFRPNTIIYHPQCHRLPSAPGTPGLNPTNCREAADLLCHDLAERTIYRTPRDIWIWVDLPGCSAGAMFPSAAQAGVLLVQCQVDVFGTMRRDCAFDSRFDAATVNVRVLPDFGQNGEPEVGERPMFMFAPERQTL